MPVKGQVYARKGKRTYRKRPAWYNKKHSVKDIAYNALKGVTYLKGLVNAELKYHDSQQTGISVNQSGVIHNITEIAQGDDEKSRDGNSIFARYLLIRGILTRNASSASATIRLMLIRDNFSTGANVTDILQTTGSSYAPLSRILPNTGKRYTILRSSLVVLDDTQAKVQPFKFDIEMKKHIKYSGSAGNQITKNAIYLVCISDQTVNLPTITYTACTKFYDN